ncbi:hypothetical protein [Paraburkholderia nemoris]|uniref:Uncharacterized protein n=1 Tax=Paraburkholderia nemoris TaxID=2793076 RepID=A0ABM8R9T1_9BURK|nr:MULTISPECIES: hypothetical protein [Paraburkholderia]MBK5147897.1 hypothetical protein [Burkholderia sp. R-69608]MBK3741927.1 hypothetical protein [Paraburkholderia aspalathi]MBK3810846.1 hypothetical protein [Paraburkholderia aspalathi]CAE6685494.1 hypothetical protein LMG22931_00015 [Paraburkholderia nemoris]CAE6740515.1 hypothetical protein R69776_02428 [Paraburkholderia nemoris]
MSASGASNVSAADTGPTAAPVAPAQPAQPVLLAPLDIRVALAAHLAGLALTMAAIVGFTVLTVLTGPSLHWLTD